MANYTDGREEGRRFPKPYRYAIVAALVLVLLVAPEVSGDNGMSPTIEKGQAVCVVDKSYSEKRGWPDRGLVVCMEKAWSVDYADDNIIGRVVGLPGDKVSIRGGRLYVNGKQYELPGEAAANVADMEEIKVKENRVFIVCDSLGVGPDSSDPKIGTMPMREIKGDVKFIIWPIKDIGGINR